MKFKKYPLDINAKKYIKEMLNVMKLDDKILKNIKLSQGEAYTYIPQKDDKPYLDDFRSGRLYPENQENEVKQYVYDKNGKKKVFLLQFQIMLLFI